MSKRVTVLGRVALAAAALAPVGCGGKDVSASPQSGWHDVGSRPPLPPPSQTEARSVSRAGSVGPEVAASSAVTDAPGEQTAGPTLAAEGEALRKELEALDAETQRGLALLAAGLKDFEAERRSWTSMDHSIGAARAVNLAVGKRNKAVVRIYDESVASALDRFRLKLEQAPPYYRRLAGERRRNLAEAKLDLERRNYLAMAEFCESAAVLCERRHEELFGAGGPTGGFASRPRRANATTLAETMANMRKLSVVSDRWEETFAAYPTSLSDGKLSSLFEHLSAYAEDLEAFTRGVESLKDAMKRKAGEGGKSAVPEPAPPRPAAPGPPQPTVAARPTQPPLPGSQVAKPSQTAGAGNAQVVVRGRTERFPGPAYPR